MNLENINALSLQLDLVGFKDMTACLAKHICMQPACFSFTKTVVIHSDELYFQFIFKADPETSLYYLDYIDAGIQKYIPLNSLVINDIEIEELDRQMKSIDWRTFFDLSETSSIEKESIFSLALRVEQIFQQFVHLSKTEEGVQVVTLLKQKYWSQFPTNELTGSFISLKAIAEISQRFYCKDQKTSVTIEDAYRFLQFKRIEKEMRAKDKKHNNSTMDLKQASTKSTIKKIGSSGHSKKSSANEKL